MLLLAHAAMPKRIAVATVDHGLRPEAAEEAAHVAQLCQRLGIPCTVLRPTEPITGNIQSSARTARYKLLEQWADAENCTWIATAHHGDDQLETILMRLARGSGVDGLAAIRARNGRIIRPMLGFAKAELEAICAAADVEPLHDPSNDNDEYDRVAMRQWLAKADHPFDLQRVARSAAALADASAALGEMADKIAAERIHTEGETLTIDATNLPRELQRRLLWNALSRLQPAAAPRGDAIDDALEALSQGKTLTLGNILCAGGTHWTLSAAPPRRAG